MQNVQVLGKNQVIQEKQKKNEMDKEAAMKRELQFVTRQKSVKKKLEVLR